MGNSEQEMGVSAWKTDNKSEKVWGENNCFLDISNISWDSIDDEFSVAVYL